MALKKRGGANKAVDIGRALRMVPSVLIKAHLLNASPYNPNKLAPEKYEALKQTIREDGFLEDLVVQKSGLNIIGGHHRYRAVKEISVEAGTPLPEIPRKVIDVDDGTARKTNLKLTHSHCE